MGNTFVKPVGASINGSLMLEEAALGTHMITPADTASGTVSDTATDTPPIHLNNTPLGIHQSFLGTTNVERGGSSSQRAAVTLPHLGAALATGYAALLFAYSNTTCRSSTEKEERSRSPVYHVVREKSAAMALSPAVAHASDGRPRALIPWKVSGKLKITSKTLLWIVDEASGQLYLSFSAASARATHIPASGSPLASVEPRIGQSTPGGVSQQGNMNNDTADSRSMPLRAHTEDGPTAFPQNALMSNDGYNASNLRTRHASGFRSSRGSQSRITAMGITPDGPFGLSESEDEFFGDSSVASFLKQIKESATTEPERGRSTAYPVPSATFGTPSIPIPPVADNSLSVKAYDLPPRQLADYLLNFYFDKIHSLYPYVHKPNFLRAYRRLWTPDTETDTETISSGLGLGDAYVPPALFHCALNIIFALGCHFSKLDHTARQATAEEFFQRSQRLLNVMSLDKGDLALVQTLLLTSQYLQGGESPSRCWNIIGLACRIAQSLGMHSLKADRTRTPAQIQMRRRIWHGCIMLDLASSMMLGRPPMTHSSAVPLPEAIDDALLDSTTATCQSPAGTLSKAEFYVRTLQLYKILRKILYDVYEPWEDRWSPDQSERPKSENELAQTLLSLDEELLEFESSLPAALQWRDAQQPAGVAGPFRRESSLLRGRFLHLRILLLRPTLVKFCRDNLPPRQAAGYPRPQQVPLKSRIAVDFGISCSTSCIETAIELSHLMNEISTTELASVWWYNVFYAFTAGVVLILAQASPAMKSRFSQPVLGNAWKSCCDCLENMDLYSNTARNCATNLRKTLSQVLGGQWHENSVHIEKTEPQTTDRHMGDDVNLSTAPNIFGLDGSEVGDGSSQGALDTQFSEALDSLWSGDDVNNSLMEMLWDDLWLAAPSFF
ncbi:hypothetical protein BO83DRAFT_414348 [Aspergillus eucalypticola CBS 122712]|uniref:Xylanolytic transcriptional activator regulatory domain-containing protein n=1 Tax=Aspergillus eucalypticola (strain CBS 122712 / IBT 29274) TaxID=1448314 RepID=A0A317W4U6_ASPEC|nr:uncharacterized protein BO83DRAFT_414348 [Aspergillus eucalypticola CBS 122712]PWY81049.1 hypothetical protein BO83DRAFT_414348 [Aspergillus eucalypticola CBS 122712]